MVKILVTLWSRPKRGRFHQAARSRRSARSRCRGRRQQQSFRHPGLPRFFLFRPDHRPSFLLRAHPPAARLPRRSDLRHHQRRRWQMRSAALRWWNQAAGQDEAGQELAPLAGWRAKRLRDVAVLLIRLPFASQVLLGEGAIV